MKNKKKSEQPEEESKGYPHYPDSEDIFVRNKEEFDIDPEDTSKTKSPNEPPDLPNEKDFKLVKTGDDLDVPGSELDDDKEATGNGTKKTITTVSEVMTMRI